MNLKKFTILSAAIAFSMVSGSSALAKVSADEAARLGKDLTPMGAERAGNADGTIPEWTGGLTTAPAGYEKGKHLVDPFANEKPLFTINASNMDQYKDKLSPGQMALMKKYSNTYKMIVYPSHRTAALPQSVYDAVKKNATTAELKSSGNGITNYQIGYPFPIPQNPYEVLWNHLTRYKGGCVQRDYARVPVQANGAFMPLEITDSWCFPDYMTDGRDAKADENMLVYFKYSIHSPPQLTGTKLLVHETLNQAKEGRKAWLYNTGQRRVRRAPQVAYDGPAQGTDGTSTSDNFDMFNGAPDRYEWKLLGKKEMYIPYNSYKLHSPEYSLVDIHTKAHPNQGLIRYELHRVWVVEGTLKDDSRHIYAKRVFHVDEDTWQIAVADHYDGHGELWRVAEAYAIQYYYEQVPWFTAETLIDLVDGRYLTTGLTNEEDAVFNYNLKAKHRDYSTGNLRRSGKR